MSKGVYLKLAQVNKLIALANKAVAEDKPAKQEPCAAADGQTLALTLNAPSQEPRVGDKPGDNPNPSNDSDSDRIIAAAEALDSLSKSVSSSSAPPAAAAAVAPAASAVVEDGSVSGDVGLLGGLLGSYTKTTKRVKWADIEGAREVAEQRRERRERRAGGREEATAVAPAASAVAPAASALAVAPAASAVVEDGFAREVASAGAPKRPKRVRPDDGGLPGADDSGGLPRAGSSSDVEQQETVMRQHNEKLYGHLCGCVVEGCQVNIGAAESLAGFLRDHWDKDTGDLRWDGSNHRLGFNNWTDSGMNGIMNAERATLDDGHTITTRQKINTMKLTNAMFDRLEQGMEAFKTVHEGAREVAEHFATERGMGSIADRAKEMHFLRQGKDVGGAVDFDFHQDEEGDITVIIKLTTDCDARTPNQMVIFGATKNFDYAAGAGGGAVFLGDAWHSSIDTSTTPGTILKAVFFFKTDERRKRRNAREARLKARDGTLGETNEARGSLPSETTTTTNCKEKPQTKDCSNTTNGKQCRENK